MTFEGIAHIMKLHIHHVVLPSDHVSSTLFLYGGGGGGSRHLFILKMTKRRLERGLKVCFDSRHLYFYDLY